MIASLPFVLRSRTLDRATEDDAHADFKPSCAGLDATAAIGRIPGSRNELRDQRACAPV